MKLKNVFSSLMSHGMIFLVFVYLFLKTLVCPKFTSFDVSLAGIVYGADWISIISNSDAPVWLPEARNDLLFELGLYFPEEK